MVRFTIVTPCLNAAPFIAEAVDSLGRQGEAQIEHLVFDAGSTDGTLDVLGRYPRATVTREPDRGSHDAMNKGVTRASGDVIGFLNADDRYADRVLPAVAEAFVADPTLDVVVGGTVFFVDDKGGTRRVLLSRDHHMDNGFWLPELCFGAPGFNGRFFRRRVFHWLGGFDVGYYFAGDRNFLIRIALAGLRSHLLGRPSYHYRVHGGSATLNQDRRNVASFAREHLRMAEEFLDSSQADRTQRRIFAAWRAFEGTRLVVTQLRQWRVGAAGAALAQLIGRDPAWPVRLEQALAWRRAVRQNDRSGAAAVALP